MLMMDNPSIQTRLAVDKSHLHLLKLFMIKCDEKMQEDESVTVDLYNNFKADRRTLVFISPADIRQMGKLTLIELWTAEKTSECIWHTSMTVNLTTLDEASRIPSGVRVQNVCLSLT
ncbi:hypothetical protein Tsp_05026 [Trichinella spiralis]|uniref:hypothetical protein n=1 Tax=Trichinella spiralis TaxID=6334 RepID=UPI0001EFEB0D|nr:hypothetical protein Tsp_05026 [Trichinella spiralis]